MPEIVDSITECAAIPGSDRTRITLSTATGAHTFDLSPEAVAALMPGLLAQPPVIGEPTVVANAISPIGCQPFESKQGLCGLAFDLGDRIMHVAVPANGIENVRDSLSIIELVYRNQKMPR
jgi:hypothetical protein